MSGARTTSLSGWLARMGFADIPRAERELAALGLAGPEFTGPELAGPGVTGEDHAVLAALAPAADPDLALAGLAQIAERDDGLLKGLAEDPAFRARLIAVLGVSRALADHLARHPEDTALLRGPDAARRPAAKEIRAEFLRAVGADPGTDQPTAAEPAAAAPGPARPVR